MHATKSEHPFLLVAKDQFDELRSRAGASPWREMRESALQIADEFRDDPAGEIRSRSQRLSRALSVTALAYILEPERSAVHRDRILAMFSAFDAADPSSITRQMMANEDKMVWNYAVPTGNAYVQAILALDVIHDDLGSAELRRIESLLRDGPATYFRDTPLGWEQGAFAVRAMWPLYERDEEVYAPIVDAWRRITLHALSDDGVFNGGTGYAGWRWTSPDREHKGLFGEILVRNGILSSWHSEPQVRAFYEWFGGYAHTPFGVSWTIGDGGPGVFPKAERTGVERAYNYSALAGAYGAALLDGQIPPAYLSTYVLTERWPLEPAASPSRVFPDGGAWLKQTSLDPASLSVVLQNLRGSDDGHAHKETNSLSFAAYGELLLRAGGYTGWNTPDSGFSWDYIHSRAISGNVALIDYDVPTDTDSERRPSAHHDHVRVSGAGITDSLLTGHLDYACGDSGDAMFTGRHSRNLVFVHPVDGVPGYAVTVDQLVSGLPGRSAQVVWHPASSTVEESPEGAYTWHVAQSSEGVDLTVFLGTRPSTTTQHDGVLSAWGGGLVGRYLVGHYASDERGRATAVTVLFPSRRGQERPTLTRLDVPGLSGARVDHGGIVDYVWESDADAPIELAPGVRAQARAGFLRARSTGEVLSLWVKDATQVDAGLFGFESDSPVTLVWRDASVQLSGAGSRLSLRCPGLVEVLVDGLPAPAWEPGPGRRTVRCAGGRRLLTLVRAAGRTEI